MTPEKRKKMITDISHEMEYALEAGCDLIKTATGVVEKVERRIREDCADIIKRKIDEIEKDVGRCVRSANLEEAMELILSSTI